MNEWNFWSIFQQFIIVLAIAMQIFVAGRIVNQANGAEQFVRATSVATGVLIFLGSKALNITFADLMMLVVVDASLYQVIVAGTILPAIIGVVVAQVTISTISKGTDFAVRILLLVGVFTLFQIGYLNYYALTKTTLSIDKALIPNLCYSLSVMLWVIFNFEDNGDFSSSRY